MTAFAHFAQETGGHIAKDNVWDNPLALEEWQQALVHVREMGWSEGQRDIQQGVVKRLAKPPMVVRQTKGILVVVLNSFRTTSITDHFLR